MGDSDEHERRHHFRGTSRPGRQVDVCYLCPGAEPVEAVTRNIGIGGAFIETAAPLPVGTRLRVSIQVPTTSAPVDVDAEVRWTEDDGMGVEFTGLDTEEVLALSEYFASLTGTDSPL